MADTTQHIENTKSRGPFNIYPVPIAFPTHRNLPAGPFIYKKKTSWKMISSQLKKAKEVRSVQKSVEPQKKLPDTSQRQGVLF
jgi:phosphatidate phosphatase APP1